MNNTTMLVEERQRDLGNFMVGRLLPFKKKRQVGPFTFIDHMGPAKLFEGSYLDVDQHPHIGLSTLTYLFEGEIEHRDSTGTVQVIRPGDVGFMTSGSGVTHTERTPAHLRNGKTSIMHGYQIWVALPKALEDMKPQFDFYGAADLPKWEENDLVITLVAGEGFGRKAPLRGYSPLFMVDVLAKKATHLYLKDQLKGEVAFVIVKGGITHEGETIEAGQMLISKTDEQCCIELQEGTQVLLFGGEPLEDEPLLLWNFVSAEKEKLQQAKADWQNKLFPKVPGDDTYIPFP
ncbi:pirin family protein [Cryomorphaceae bacterium S-15]|uniref:Pirin family protein n=2 Tax=Acidiluteibacter ferrifornacis TaxID=2692424 RepID=A0A6N9NSW0_9FLAO|nr:pirin family protein [Acidiluteibacter ferrifornacis]